MGIAILARQIRVDLFIVRPYCVRAVDLAEMLLKAYPKPRAARLWYVVAVRFATRVEPHTVAPGW